MTIIETCPKCNSRLQRIILTSNPPQNKVICDNCGYENIEKEKVIIISYKERTK